MSNETLKIANKMIKACRPKINVDKVCDVFLTERLLEIGFLSKQCRNDARGTCIMCDYGCANGSRENDIYIIQMKKILKEYEGMYDSLLVCTNGNFMDEYQIQNDLFCKILNETNEYSFSKLEIETHFQTVTKEKLDEISKIVRNKTISIECGLETINEDIQNKLIMKDISLRDVAKTIDLIHSYGFEVELNILLGLPFLSLHEQLHDALKTTEWVFNNNCNLVIFPVNIKPFTLLKNMYSHGFYEPISHWLLIQYLNRIPTEYLNRITVAWYGNREEVYDGVSERVIFPLSCPICHDRLLKFYSEFNNSSSSSFRKALLDNIINNRECECYDILLKKMNTNSSIDFSEEYKKYVEFVRKEFKI